ncbi:MAG TPA: hypothetical protein VF530_07525 [Planctomycetota bacterium]
MAILVGLALAGARAQEPAEERGTFLARVPEGITIPTTLRERAGRGTFYRREALAWSADGLTVAYTGLRGERYVPVVGSEVGEEYGFVGAPTVAGGHAVFHVARRKDEEREQHWLWIDGKTLGPEDWMDEPVVRADGQQVLVWTGPDMRFGPNAPPTGKRVLLKASARGSQWSLARGDDWFECGPIRFAGEHGYAAAIQQGKGWTVFRAEKRARVLVEPCEGIESFAVAPDGTLAHVRTRPEAGRAFLSAADEPQLFLGERRVGRGHAVVSLATLDPSGKHLAYVVARDGGRTVAVGEEPTPRGVFDFVLELAFAPGGKRLAFVAVRGGTPDPELPGWVRNGRWCVAARGVEPGAEPEERESHLEVRDPCWDARGERLAYAARDVDGWRVISGETVGPPHAEVGPPVFAADGTTLGYGSRDGDELWWRELKLR